MVSSRRTQNHEPGLEDAKERGGCSSFRWHSKRRHTHDLIEHGRIPLERLHQHQSHNPLQSAVYGVTNHVGD